MRAIIVYAKEVYNPYPAYKTADKSLVPWKYN